MLPLTWQQRMRIEIGRFMSWLQGAGQRIDSGVSYVQFPLDLDFTALYIEAVKKPEFPFFLRAIDPSEFSQETNQRYLRLYVTVETFPRVTIAWVEIVNSPQDNAAVGFNGLVHAYPHTELEFLWLSTTLNQFYRLYQNVYPENLKDPIGRLMSHDQRYANTIYLISLQFSSLLTLQPGESYEEYSIVRELISLTITQQE